MPHLHIEKFNKLELPYEKNGVSFNFFAQNTKHDDEMLISTTVEDEDFFLLLKDDENKTLLKTDKLTRPASTQKVHNALLTYAKEANLKVISSNVHTSAKNIHLEKITALKKIEYFADKFPDAKNVAIEVGFGSGRHLLHQAKNNPNTLYIGIEIHRPSIEQVLKQINIQELDNLLVLDYDARLFMELIPSNRVGQIFVHFPVPWDKKPHRRVISTSFIEEARRVLKVGGTLELRTDSENYYAYSYETFINFPKIELNIRKNSDIEVSSKYEDRWKRMEKNIYDVTMLNDLESEQFCIDGDFKFSEYNNANNKKLLDLGGVTKRFEGGFIHFERTYILEKGIMLRVSMGSYDRPEHLYILISANEINYYPSMPLKSRSNIRAHKILNEVLNG
ncbi:tRNA (guanosine(46)-N7)-methyltransferase TrmB [Sulfurimonas lithotrophica]|uniref:tRNA (guanine-N(7)-)-methyltransferase n=1 Tax=Sulfurimonas lithotrophica TaxID=2590022 RepID=A0A5P8P1T2_9BACT|nr:tRNA (guanosine(46)-N7)-methyltransferase TrmB [Sulfurimonas lithotrophica]QFR49625.1 tRNA (guanosine(46)-N7)-methyltransferase TrmB [Sulfurimonas lithotrophica]